MRRTKLIPNMPHCLKCRARAAPDMAPKMKANQISAIKVVFGLSADAVVESIEECLSASDEIKLVIIPVR